MQTSLAKHHQVVTQYSKDPTSRLYPLNQPLFPLYPCSFYHRMYAVDAVSLNYDQDVVEYRKSKQIPPPPPN